MRFTSSNIVITYGMAWHGFITTPHYLLIVFKAIHRHLSPFLPFRLHINSHHYGTWHDTSGFYCSKSYNILYDDIHHMTLLLLHIVLYSHLFTSQVSNIFTIYPNVPGQVPIITSFNFSFNLFSIMAH